MVFIAGTIFAETKIDFSFVDGSCYSKITNLSTYWDKSVEYARQDLTIWNELWIPKNWNLYFNSIDLNYKVNLADGSYNAIASMNYYVPVSNNYTFGLGIGAYWTENLQLSCLVAINRCNFDLTIPFIKICIFEFKDVNNLYFLIPYQLQLKNDIILKVNVLKIYLNFLARQEFFNNQFTTFNCIGTEINF